MGGTAAAFTDFFGGAAAADAGAAALGTDAILAGTAATGGFSSGFGLAGADLATQVAAGSLGVSDALAQGASVGDLVNAGVSSDALANAGISADQIASATSQAGTLADTAGATAPAAAPPAAAPTPAGLESAAASAQSTPFQLPDGTMGSIQGGNILDSAGNVVAKGGVGTTLSDLAGYAKTGAQLIGGIGQLGQAASLLGGGQTKPGVADPYAQYRSQAAAQLQNLLANPSTITSTPGYQFNLAQGLQAQQAQQAAQGRLVSGGGLLQAQQFGQQYATSQLGQQQQLLAQLSGATQAPAGAATAQQGINFGQAGALGLGLQGLGGGTANVLNPLQTLYAQYNQPSPSVS
jgi:hypothetical protein